MSRVTDEETWLHQIMKEWSKSKDFSKLRRIRRHATNLLDLEDVETDLVDCECWKAKNTPEKVKKEQEHLFLFDDSPLKAWLEQK